jgi:hypothetical protein
MRKVLLGWQRAVIVFAAVLAVSFLAQNGRAQGLDACGPAPSVKTALDAIPSRQTPAQYDWQFHEQQLSAVQALMKEFTADIFVERRYINMMSDSEDKDKVIQEFKARHEQAPDDPKWSYLYALTLRGRDTPESIKLFDEALAKAPNFAWPHLSLVSIYNSPVFLDKAKAEEHMKAFMAACPSSLDGYRSLTSFDDKAMIAEYAPKLRTLLQPRTDTEALGAYPTLWSLEFKAHPVSEYAPLRKQVTEDLQRIRALSLQDKPEWYEALEEGYKLVNDQKQSDWARDERVTRFPSPWELLAMSKWAKDHKYPASDAPADQKQQYFTEFLKLSADWVKQRPYTTYLVWERTDAMEHLDNVPAADVVAAVDKGLEAAKANAGPRDLDSSDYFNGAEVLTKKHLQPERAAELAEKGLARLEIENKQVNYDLYDTKERLDESHFYQPSTRIYGMTLLADAYIQSKQTDKAQAELAQLAQRLQDLKPLAGDKQNFKDQATNQESAYWGLMARLAESEGRKLDAMAYYENALLDRLAAKQKPETGVKDELADNAQTLWKSLGGTDDGWTNWYGKQANELAQQATLTWEDANLPLPTFDLADLQGKTWQPVNLKGKVTFLNFWASW